MEFVTIIVICSIIVVETVRSNILGRCLLVMYVHTGQYMAYMLRCHFLILDKSLLLENSVEV